MSKDITLEVRHVSKQYDLKYKYSNNLKQVVLELFQRKFSPEKTKHLQDTKLLALDDISFSLKQGEVLGIIGDNGAGKSTLLRILSGISTPTLGEIYINGKISSILEVGTGFHAELSGKQNIFLSGEILGMSKEEIEEQYESIVEFSGIKKFIDVPIKRYSSGMFVRLAFSVAAHLNSEIILLDEVISVGDAEFRIKSYNKIKKLASENRSIVVVSHDLGSIAELCNRVIIIEKGKIVKDGHPRELVDTYMENTILGIIEENKDDQTEEERRKLQEDLDILQSQLNEMGKAVAEKDDELIKKLESESQLAEELQAAKDTMNSLIQSREEAIVQKEDELKTILNEKERNLELAINEAKEEARRKEEKLREAIQEKEQISKEKQELDNLKKELEDREKLKERFKEEESRIKKQKLKQLKKHRYWADPKKAPGNDIIRIREIEVAADGKSHEDDIFMDEDVLIKFIYEKLKPCSSVTSMVVKYNLNENILGVLPYHSTEDSIIEDDEQKGIYSAVCRIPANLLNSGIFTIDLFFADKDMTLILMAEQLINFKVNMKAFTYNDFVYDGSYSGPLYPVTKWTVKHLEAKV